MMATCFCAYIAFIPTSSVIRLWMNESVTENGLETTVLNRNDKLNWHC